MPQGKRMFSLPATNEPQAGFSFKAGNPTIQFSVPANDVLLDTRSLRLVGSIVIKDSTGSAISLDSTHIDQSNGVNVTKAASTNIQSFTGVDGVISKVVLQSKKTKLEIQQVLQYPEYLTLREAWRRNKTDYRCIPQNTSLGFGTNDSISRRMTVSSSDGKPFTTDLSIALLQGQRLHLGPDRLGGLLLQVHLAPDSQFLSSLYRILPTGVAAADPTGASYELKDLRLEGNYYTPTPQEVSAYPDGLALPTRLSLLGELVSSVDSSTFTPMASRVQGFINVYQTETQENSYLRQATDFKLPVGVEKYITYKDGIRMPSKYEIEVKPNFRSVTEGAGVGDFDPLSLTQPIHSQGLAELQKYFEQSIFAGGEMRHYSPSMAAINKSLKAEQATGADANDGKGSNLDVAPLGIGHDSTFGVVGMMGSYVNQDTGLRLTSGVNTGNGKLATDFRSVSYIQRLFVPLIELFSTKTLVKTML